MGQTKQRSARHTGQETRKDISRIIGAENSAERPHGHHTFQSQRHDAASDGKDSAQGRQHQRNGHAEGRCND